MIPHRKRHNDEEDIQVVAEVLRSSVLIRGPMVEQFERTIAD